MLLTYLQSVHVFAALFSKESYKKHMLLWTFSNLEVVYFISTCFRRGGVSVDPLSVGHVVSHRVHIDTLKLHNDPDKES